MPSILTRILLFLSSYAPLAAIFALLFFTRQPIVAIVSTCVAVLGVVGILLYLAVARRLHGVPTMIAERHSRDEEAMSYIVTYIIPFLAVAFSEWQQAVALVVFLVILGFLYVNSNMIHINPTLNFLGYRLYEVTLGDGSTFSLIARGRVQKGGTLSLIRVGDDILLERRK